MALRENDTSGGGPAMALRENESREEAAIAVPQESDTAEGNTKKAWRENETWDGGRASRTKGMADLFHFIFWVVLNLVDCFFAKHGVVLRILRLRLDRDCESRFDRSQLICAVVGQEEHGIMIPGTFGHS